MQMQIPVPRWLQELWEIWDLRAVIILSLSLQTFLILFASSRKRTHNNCKLMLLGAAYLLADWFANLAVGLISSSQSNTRGKSTKKDIYDADVLAFWIPFLLVHLGGPDTITAFALEDNDLWHRHLLGLIFQTSAAIYVFIQTLPKNQLWLPTVLMFISGVIKYAERTVSLYVASLNNFRHSLLKDPDPGPNFSKLMDAYLSQKEAGLPARIEIIAAPVRVNKVKEGKLSDTEMVLYAYKLFDTFKGLIVDLKFSLRERTQSRNFFLRREAEDAYEVIIMELSFMYDVLFTKASVMYTRWGYFRRFVSFALVVTSLGLFYSRDKKNFSPSDVAITYTLLLGAIALDVIAFIHLITSDWVRVSVEKLPDMPGPDLEGGSTSTQQTSLLQKFVPWPRVQRGRWSESVSTYNLIDYCLNPRRPECEKLIEKIGLTSFLNEWKYVKDQPFTMELWKHIFEELKTKSELTEDLGAADDRGGAKVEFVLRLEGCDELLPYVVDAEYDQSLLKWHIATDLCYWDEMSDQNNSKPQKDISKRLSDYMLYLVAMQPNVMFEVSDIGQSRLRDTCAEAQKFFFGISEYERKLKLSTCQVIIYVLGSAILVIIVGLLIFPLYLFFFIFVLMAIIIDLFVVCIFWPLRPLLKWMEKQRPKCMEKLRPKCIEKLSKWVQDRNENGRASPRIKNDYSDECRRILGVNTEIDPDLIKGGRSKSVLFDACILAKKLKSMDDKKWIILSKVWVEMLSYAAIQCRPRAYAQLLRGGGELIVIVWLLMSHLGLGYRPQNNPRRAKFIVDK